MENNNDTIHIELLKKTGFTPREIDIIKLFCTGKSDKQIANCLLISNRTVQTHIMHIYRQLGITHTATNNRLSAFITLVAHEIIKVSLINETN